MSKYLFYIFCFIFISCSHVEKKSAESVDIGEHVFLSLKQTSAILPEIQLVQLLKIEHPKGNHSAQVILNVQKNKITILSLLPFGGELFRVEYENGVITAKSLPSVQDSMDLRYALADIILVYANADVLKTWLSEAAEIIELPNRRIIRAHGKELIQIDYQGAEKFKSSIRYQHFLRKYKISITPISQSPPGEK